jgi:hypothetical protein
MNFNPNKMTPAEVKKARVLRVNTTSLKHVIIPSFNAVTPSMRRDIGAYNGPRKRKPGEVESPSFSRIKEKSVYRTGDGEYGVIDRPGSHIAYTLPSRGIGA